ncbi:MAG: D-alanyl-D-alanine carboxypeptidase [Parcubacteria group bacterium]|nr:D-alanyl-D-alanine carboxypeptidase [Parcubacteria group bacterium]
MRQPQLSERDSKILGLVVLTAIVGVLGFSMNKYGSSKVEITILDKPAIVSPFEGVKVEAKSAYVWDVNNRRMLFGKNEEAQHPLASLTKIMTALIALESAPGNSLITIGKNSIETEGDSGLLEGEKWALSNLLEFTLIVSSNDGAHAVASAISSLSDKSDIQTTVEEVTFVNRMNTLATEIGLVQTYFLNETGLDTNLSVGGGYGSARDVARLFEYAISKSPHLIEATSYGELPYNSSANEMIVAENTNEAIENISGVMGSKTGFTDLAGGNLVIAYDAGLNHPIIISVLGSSADGRFDDVSKLVSASLKAVGQSL